jgi:transposase-like protein
LTPKKWISQLKTGQKLSKKQSSRRAEAQKLFYTEEFKQRIVNEVLSGKLNKNQASKLYGIRGNATILYWIRQSQGLDPTLATPKTVANFSEMKKSVTDKKLVEENKELRELLKVAELRADVWQKAVERLCLHEYK